MSGKVYLVGAGPGDRGLMTLKGMSCLEQADVVVYDRLLDSSLIDAAPESAERVFVGKERGRQELTQAEINRLLVDRAAEGKVVVRLKGGDPFVFGRGGEEALALAESGVSFEVVPGVTSAVGAPAYAGIPLTHRGIATSFTVVSGSEDPTKGKSSVNWAALAKAGGTIVVLMGWSSLEAILTTLALEGMEPSTPVALVQWGTWPDQATVTGRLDNAVTLGREAGLRPPVAAVIGRVVDLRDKLAWFDQRPLFGKKVLITRSRAQASQFRAKLEELGAQPVEIPTIRTAPLDDYTELDDALGRLSSYYSWVIFASGNAVDAVFSRLTHLSKDARAFGGVSVGAIGPATSDALSGRGIDADFIPARSVSEAVLEELSQREWDGVPVLLPGADIGRDVLHRGLTGLGARVDLIPAYRTVPVTGMKDKARKALESGMDVVTFTSSSTVKNLLDLLDGDTEALGGSRIACIGPTTAATAEELGLTVDLVADIHTVDGLLNALVSYLGK